MSLQSTIYKQYAMKKLVLLVLSLLPLASLSYGQSNQSALIVNHKDGTQTRVELSTRPNVTFQNDSVNIASTSVTLKYAVADVARFTYENVGSGILSTKNDATYRMDGDNLYFTGIATADKISLYTAEGKLLPVKLLSSASGFCLSISGLPSGIYLLKVNGRTAKIVKK